MAAALLAVVAVMAGPGTASAATSCRPISARGSGSGAVDPTTGVTTTTATVRGGGLLTGTTLGTFTGPPEGFGGHVVFTTAAGAHLDATVTGSLDLGTGRFLATSSMLAGDGRLAGATGHLVLDGRQDLTTGLFAEDVTGRLCVDLAP